MRMVRELAPSLSLRAPSLQGGAPVGMQFVDHEEIWQINESTGQGEWVPVEK